MHKWCSDKTRPFFGENNLKIHYLNTDAFIFSFKPIKGLLEDLKHFKEDFHLRDLDPSHEPKSKDNKNVVKKLN